MGMRGGGIRGTRRQKKNVVGRERNPPLRVVVNPGRAFMPDRYRTMLTFQKTVAVTNAGLGYANVRFSPTNAYDVDPVLGSTACPGFLPLTTLYRRYRTDSAVCRVGFANLDLIALTAYITADNQDPGSNTATYQPLLSNRYSVNRVIGLGTGNSSGALTLRASTAQFGGVRNVGQDDSYSALSGNSPTNNWWFAVGVVSTGAIANGVHISFRCDLTIEFYELGTPAA